MRDIAYDVSQLNGAYPIALLPVRVETRFDRNARALKIRIYPDAIFADGHRLELTKDEWHDGTLYWDRGWDPANERDAWRALLTRYPAQRAAWIVEATTPANLAARGEAGSAPAPPSNFVARRLPADQDQTLPAYVARCLPSAWLAIAYRDGVEVHRATREVVEPIHLTFSGTATQGNDERDELRIERELLWTVDFDQAEKQGMAFTMPLDLHDLEVGFDRLIVIGVRNLPNGMRGAQELARLLDAQHYTRGLAFVAQGTPTNNSALGSAGYPPPADPDRTFAIERGPGDVVPGSDGQAVADALGLPAVGDDPARPLDRLEGTERTEGAVAAAMNTALWPCTLGYYLQQMMFPLLQPWHIEAVRTHFRAFVRGRGPLPAVRVGRVPYGILPATSVTRWMPAQASAFPTGTHVRPGVQSAYVFDTSEAPDIVESKLAGLLQVWRAHYLERAESVPRVGLSADADADLLAALAREPSSRELRIRAVYGSAFVRNLRMLLRRPDGDSEVEEQARIERAYDAMAAVGLAGYPSPRIMSKTFADQAPRYRGRWVPPPPPPPRQDLRDPAQVMDSHPFDGSLLGYLLRESLRIEGVRVGTMAAIARGTATEEELVHGELHGLDGGNQRRPTTGERLSSPVSGVTGGDTLGNWLLEPSDDQARAPIRELLAAIERLERAPTDELERLLSETLDVCSHRLDAWLTSMATRRLDTMRRAHPTGIHIGAFGWLENLRPRGKRHSASAGGFVHAPSPTHAATAAILRNAYLSRTGEARKQAAVDMSSGRVRSALELLDGVRQGLPLGAVLGFHLERALHDSHRNLDRYIAEFRRQFPLGRDPAVPRDQEGEQIAARNVVDGLAVWTSGLADQDQRPPFLHGSDTAWPDIRNCLRLLDRSVDALADVLLADSVYQVIQGKTDRAAATLSSLGGGGAIPVPDVVTTPHPGISVGHRVVVALSTATTAPPDGWTETPRHRAEPRLDAWLAEQMLALPRAIVSASYADRIEGEPDRRTVQTVTLAELHLAPLDVLAMAQATTPAGAGELDARLRDLIGRRRDLVFDHNPPLHDRLHEMTILEALDIARLLAEAVGGARPLTATDLLPSGMTASSSTVDEGELARRAEQANDALVAARQGLADADAQPVAALRNALRNAAGLGVRSAVPPSFTDDEDEEAEHAALVAVTEKTLVELTRRAAAADAATSSAARIAAVFGSGFPVVPTFTPDNGDELQNAFQSSGSLADSADVWRWFEGVARVRPPLAALRLAAMAVEATGGARLEPCAVQVPHVPDQPWVATSFDPRDPDKYPRRGSVAITFDRAPIWPVSSERRRCAGLVLDEWTERIPALTQDTAFAVHHDTPGAEAPQCILLAVPPVLGPSWDLDSLLAIVHETFDLARIRCVDAEDLDVAAIFAPTTYVESNLADQVLSPAVAQTVADTVIEDPE